MTTNQKLITVHSHFREFMRAGKGRFSAMSGGIFTYQKEITSRLAKYKDLNVDPFYFSSIHAEDSEGDFALRRVRFPGSLIYRQKTAGIIRKSLRAVFDLVRPFVSFDSLIGGSSDDIYLFFFSLPDLKIRGKSIAVVYDITPLRLEERDNDGEAGYLRKNYRKAFLEEMQDIIKRAEKIVTISEFTRKDFADYFHFDESKIEIAYCGINPSAYSGQYDLNHIREKYNLPEKYMLYFGSCHMRKNIETLIRAYAKLPENLRREYKLVITNPNDKVTECVNECGISDYVHYIRSIPENEKPAIYRMSSVSVYPSIYEGFGIPILEAMASGTPVITSNVTSMPEVAGDAAILVDPLDDSAMAHEIERVLTDENLRKELIAKGYENIKRFSWDESARKFHDIIVNL